MGTGAPGAGCRTLRRRCYQLVLVSLKGCDEAGYVSVGKMADYNYWNRLSSQGEDRLNAHENPGAQEEVCVSLPSSSL